MKPALVSPCVLWDSDTQNALIPLKIYAPEEGVNGMELLHV